MKKIYKSYYKKQKSKYFTVKKKLTLDIITFDKDFIRFCIINNAVNISQLYKNISL